MVKLPMPAAVREVISSGEGELAQLTGQNKVLEGLDADGAGAGVDEEDVCRLEGGLAGGGPQAELTVVLPLLLRGPVEDGRRLGEDLGHFVNLCPRGCRVRLVGSIGAP